MTSNLKELVKKNKKYVKQDINLNEIIDKFLQNQQNKKSQYFIPAFHPSMISKGVECQLWWYYFLKNEEALPEVWKDENLTAMLVGKGIHDQMQRTFYEMGLLEGVWKCKHCGHEFWATAPQNQCPECNQPFKSWNYLDFKEVPIRTGLIRGHADGLINQQGTRFLLEIKSIKNKAHSNARYGFECLGARPMDDHFIQTQLYLNGWFELAKKAPLGEEPIVQENGVVSTEKLSGPVYDGAKTIGVINQGIVEYIAKNSSEKKSYLIKRNQSSIQFILDEMQTIWKAFLEDDLDSLKGVDYTTNKSKCKQCPYRSVCNWT